MTLLDTPVYGGPTCRPASRFAGPAVVEQLDFDRRVPPGTTAEVDQYLNIIIRVKA